MHQVLRRLDEAGEMTFDKRQVEHSAGAVTSGVCGQCSLKEGYSTYLGLLSGFFKRSARTKSRSSEEKLDGNGCKTRV